MFASFFIFKSLLFKIILMMKKENKTNWDITLISTKTISKLFLLYFVPNLNPTRNLAQSIITG